MLPVTSINGQVIGDVKMGNITSSLLKTWGDNVGVDIAAQIKGWNRTSKKKAGNAPSPYAFKQKK